MDVLVSLWSEMYIHLRDAQDRKIMSVIYYPRRLTQQSVKGSTVPTCSPQETQWWLVRLQLSMTRGIQHTGQNTNNNTRAAIQLPIVGKVSIRVRDSCWQLGHWRITCGCLEKVMSTILPVFVVVVDVVVSVVVAVLCCVPCCCGLTFSSQSASDTIVATGTTSIGSTWS